MIKHLEKIGGTILIIFGKSWVYRGHSSELPKQEWRNSWKVTRTDT